MYTQGSTSTNAQGMTTSSVSTSSTDVVDGVAIRLRCPPPAASAPGATSNAAILRLEGGLSGPR
jgi:hypothetical protein